MPPTTSQHRRTHNLLLINKLLDQRDATSPFTLVLDSLEQSARPLIAEYVRRAKITGVHVFFVSSETLSKPLNVDVFVEAWNQTLQSWEKSLQNELRRLQRRRCLIVFDSLYQLCATPDSNNLPALLSSFIGPTTSLLAVYHTDIGRPSARTPLHQNVYAPSPLTLLRYLATTVCTVHSLHHVLERKTARDRSHIEPSFGLAEGKEGVLQSLGANGSEGVVLEMEHRRKSGRGIREWYYMPVVTYRDGPEGSGAKDRTAVMLLDDHPLYRTPEHDRAAEPSEADGTFELGLTAKQRQDRDGVVLPYFDAQTGGGEGGRILYDMGSEDDFDEEEDEI
ncbi:hypothetical protein BAUCODRAFT_148121 [Baudoinia panamericana UAMH 10762]|uniref:Elongator complex protein 5 n=1 Tax=Baudoinia panamericana (strain UAMH 10762) TaxID=717646 RepID=M2MY89_BAUPA|nr:uncharacterized protein BAUCODRAFT_148121 [Baudoinia panamericana UAMH 10762]EMC96523.1 hypothetical protein BAUCODRAFT_148121 [Baudoinia panamericana UAMH 10762]